MYYQNYEYFTDNSTYRKYPSNIPGKHEIKKLPKKSTMGTA
jgi:hypothetical protein